MSDDATTLRPLSAWHEDVGEVLWWKLPIVEPPYVGSPLANDWPGYHTHFTKFVVPTADEQLAAFRSAYEERAWKIVVAATKNLEERQNGHAGGTGSLNFRTELVKLIAEALIEEAGNAT